MIKLKNSDREEVLRRVLTHSFTKRFKDIETKLQDAIKRRLINEHPIFMGLMQRDETKQYVADTSVNAIFLDDDGSMLRVAQPKYGLNVEMLAYRQYCDRKFYISIGAPDVRVPARFGEVKIADKKILAAYKKTWKDYEAAYEKLTAVLNSYVAREKLETDFPELAKHLPPLEVKAKLPMVIVSDVRKSLAACGVEP